MIRTENQWNNAMFYEISERSGFMKKKGVYIIKK